MTYTEFKTEFEAALTECLQFTNNKSIITHLRLAEADLELILMSSAENDPDILDGGEAIFNEFDRIFGVFDRLEVEWWNRLAFELEIEWDVE